MPPAASDPPPPTRWDRGFSGTVSPYSATFGRLIAEGADVDGEARLADALVPRHARILDAGSGMGRVAAALASRGHDVTALEKDPALVAESRARYPDVPVLAADILELSRGRLVDEGRPPTFDLAVLVGNVLVYVADGTETRVLASIGALLAPEGRIMVGFHPVAGPPHSRDYPYAEFAGHVEAAGLAVQHRFGGYALEPPTPDYVVAVLSRNEAS